MSDRDLTHLKDDGTVEMVDVGSKQVTTREAIASALVRMSPPTLQLVREKALPKGDALAAARIAGVFAAKQTSNLIPLTHPLAITYANVDFEIRDEGIAILATVRCEGKTGVEIEAMTACSIAALTIYDMCKSADKAIVIEQVRLERKSGGKSGVYQRSG